MNHLLESDVFLNFNATKNLSTKIANYIPESIIPVKKIQKQWLDAINNENKEKLLELIKLSESNRLGVLSDNAIKKLHELNVNLPNIGKVRFNPFQVKKGEDQVLGSTPVDLKIYEKRQVLPVSLSILDKNNTIGQVGGKNNSVGEFGYVILIPAYGAKISEENLSFYKETFGKDLKLIVSGDNKVDNLNIFIYEEETPIYAVNDKNIDLFQKSIMQGSMKSFISQQTKYKSTVNQKGKEESQDSSEVDDSEEKNESLIYKKSISKFLFESR